MPCLLFICKTILYRWFSTHKPKTQEMRLRELQEGKWEKTVPGEKKKFDSDFYITGLLRILIGNRQETIQEFPTHFFSIAVEHWQTLTTSWNILLTTMRKKICTKYNCLPKKSRRMSWIIMIITKNSSVKWLDTRATFKNISNFPYTKNNK